ncbi:MAG: ABC transporter ATP-binding protein [Deltaproteobacteria bacterium]|nr:ABC transporter ATP-binding protein [Deltaproteobacteria bacterium]
MSDTPLIECRALCKSYEDVAVRVDVLKGLDLRIEAGDMTAVVGVSGVGKTTLLYILGLLERPTGGDVLYEGQNVFDGKTDWELSRFRNEVIGFVFQFHNLIPEFTAVENAMMPAIIAGLGKREAREKAMEALSILGVADRAEHKPGEISGGEQQRVAVARALVMRPRVVLADEPTGNLDVDTAARMHDEFIRLNEELGLTFIVVTHNEALARRMRQVVRLHGGTAGRAA